MNTQSEINEIEALLNKNRMLLNVLIGYCKYDINRTDAIANILTTLEIIVEQQDKMKNLIEKFYLNSYSGLNLAD